MNFTNSQGDSCNLPNFYMDFPSESFYTNCWGHTLICTWFLWGYIHQIVPFFSVVIHQIVRSEDRDRVIENWASIYYSFWIWATAWHQSLCGVFLSFQSPTTEKKNGSSERVVQVGLWNYDWACVCCWQ